MHDEDITLRILAMKCWGEVFRSELSQKANELLLVQVNSISADVMVQMKIDLWKYDRGGMYLLENLAWSAGSLPTATTTSGGTGTVGNETIVAGGGGRGSAGSLKGDENYELFSRWVEDLSEDIRDAFETQISNTADRMRQEVMSNRSKAVRHRKEKWELYSNQCVSHSRELFEYLVQLFAAKRREAREIQREQMDLMRNRISEWIVESTYSANLSKSFLERLRNQHLLSVTNSASTTNTTNTSGRGRRLIRTRQTQVITTIPPSLLGGGEYLPFSKWSQDGNGGEFAMPGTRKDSSDSTPFFVESIEVAEAAGEWALELSEGSNRMRRRIRRGNLALVPVYLTSGNCSCSC